MSDAPPPKRIRVGSEDVKYHPEEVGIIETRAFQRLFDMEQLGLAHVVYPRASHTRGYHSMHCVHEVEQILSGTRLADEGGRPLTVDEKRPVRISALLHDIGHVPYSHTLEDEHQILGKHDRPKRVEKALEILASQIEHPGSQNALEQARPIILRMAEGNESTQNWQTQAVSNTISADLLAYIQADALITGIEKRSGHYRLYEHFVIHNDKLAIKLTRGGLRPDIVSAIMDLLDMRYALTERVYFHHAKAVASAMLARAATIVDLEDSDDLLLMGDERFRIFLLDRAEGRGDTDAKGLLERLFSRRLHKRIFKVGLSARENHDASRGANDRFCARWRDANRVNKFLSDLEQRFELPEGALVLWCPDEKTGAKYVRANVVWETSSGGLEGPHELRGDDVERQFPGVYRRVKAVESVYADLWACWIALDRRFLDKSHAIVRAIEADMEIQCDPVFEETYLRKIEGWDQAKERHRGIYGVMSSLVPAVDENLGQQAARKGMPNVANQGLDDAAILQSVRTAADAKLKPKGRQKKITDGRSEGSSDAT